MNGASLNSHAINSTSLVYSVRVLVVSYAYAVATPIASAIDGTKRIFANVLAYANAAIFERALVAGKVAGEAGPTTTVTLRALARDVAQRNAFGDALVSSTVVTPGYISSQIVGNVQVNSEVIARLATRLVTSADSSAQTSVRNSALLRSVVDSTAVATGYVHPTSAIQLPFDKKAIPENTFMVPAKVGTFYVR